MTSRLKNFKSQMNDPCCGCVTRIGSIGPGIFEFNFGDQNLRFSINGAAGKGDMESYASLFVSCVESRNSVVNDPADKNPECLGVTTAGKGDMDSYASLFVSCVESRKSVVNDPADKNPECFASLKCAQDSHFLVKSIINTPIESDLTPVNLRYL